MTLGEKTLRRLIREVLASESPDPAHAETGPDIKPSPVAKAAEKRLDSFPSINTALANIKTSKDLQALIQNILDKVVVKGEIDQSEMQLALSKSLTAARKAGQEKEKQEKQEKDKEEKE